MVRRPVNAPAGGWSLTFRPRDWSRLSGHLHDDGDEHGAVVLARVSTGYRGPRLLAEHVLLAQDGVDYVPGDVGHRMLAPDFIRKCALHARRLGLAYLAFHNHGGWEHVRFSSVDLASHERGYPALVQITGQVVGGVVCTPSAAAGALWLPGGERAELAELVVPGANLVRLRPSPMKGSAGSSRFDRQARLFGDAGQDCFREMRVAIVGQGGVGSLLTEMIARLGVGSVVLIDDDVVDETNLPRLVGATADDVDHPKVVIGARNARAANPDVEIIEVKNAIQAPEARDLVAGVDWIFLAADTNAARHWVTVIGEERLIPATQLGVKVPTDDSHVVGAIHVATRHMVPGQGCFWCNGLIDATELAIDMHPPSERKAARYVEGVPAPSVMSLNALTASQAVTDFMLAVTQMRDDDIDLDVLYFPRDRRYRQILRRRRDDCPFCGERSLG
jgi:hypothetical protein